VDQSHWCVPQVSESGRVKEQHAPGSYLTPDALVIAGRLEDSFLTPDGLVSADCSVADAMEYWTVAPMDCEIAGTSTHDL
jgi:hypothetical protein